MAKVLIHPASYETVRSAVDRAFEIFPVQVKGKRVLIKPNVLRASEASENIVTHPTVLQAVVEKVRSLGPASLVVGDNPGLFNYGDNELCFNKTGLMEATLGHYRNIGNESVQLPFNPEYMQTVGISKEIAEADVFISLPKFKTHGLTVMSGAIKNSYGILPGAQKARLHQASGNPYRFHEVIVDVFRLRVPDLFIMDGIVGMEGNGPASPDLRDVGLILAADNAVAMDSVVATLMGCDPAKLRFLQKAKEHGLGDYNMSTIEVIGEMTPIPDWKLPPLGGEAMVGNAAVQALIQGKVVVHPSVDETMCTACGTCVEHCPVSALSMQGSFPAADPAKCIACFCCQEMCPEKAITLR